MRLCLSRKDSCRRQRLSPKNTPLLLTAIKALEYLNLILENQIDIEKQICDKNKTAVFRIHPFLIMGDKSFQDIDPYLNKK